uniref:Uncharacterized protein n=1 Tax=Anas platyrhynchos platyrhynchos TaxID=8840 RepID=A0A493T918_ANAPP
MLCAAGPASRLPLNHPCCSPIDLAPPPVCRLPPRLAERAATSTLSPLIGSLPPIPAGPAPLRSPSALPIGRRGRLGRRAARGLAARAARQRSEQAAGWGAPVSTSERSGAGPVAAGGPQDAAGSRGGQGRAGPGRAGGGHRHPPSPGATDARSGRRGEQAPPSWMRGVVRMVDKNIYIVQGEINAVVGAIKRNARWSTHTHLDEERDPLLHSFSVLKEVLNNITACEVVPVQHIRSECKCAVRSGPCPGLQVPCRFPSITAGSTAWMYIG